MGFLTLIKSLSGSLRKKGSPHSYEDTAEGYDIGDTKQFTDGSVRVLGYAPSGQRRWLSTKEAEEQGIRAGGSPQGESAQTSSFIQDIPEEIIVDEWKSFNEYLSEDNPFLRCMTYGQMESTWFSRAYELQSRFEEGNNNDVEKKYEELDKQFLAILMYKVSCLIYQINEWQPEFDYKEFIKDKKWQDLVDYLENLKAPQEVNYMDLYND